MFAHKVDNQTYFLLGRLDSAAECLAAANASGFNVFTCVHVCCGRLWWWWWWWWWLWWWWWWWLWWW